MLKAWIVLGAESTTSKTGHFDCWPDVKRLTELPSDKDLEGMAPTEWKDHTDIIDLDYSHAAEVAPTHRVGQEQAPVDVHAAAQAMWASGELAETTPAQRRRNPMCSGVSYGTPPRYTALLKYGYISPNLPAPSGYQWRSHAGVWSLQPRGG